MNKFSLIAFAAASSLALAACGDADDASEDAMADTVEMPANEAMTNVPDPVAAPTTSDAAADASADAADITDPTVEAADAAEAAAADAAAAAEAATDATVDAQ